MLLPNEKSSGSQMSKHSLKAAGQPVGGIQACLPSRLRPPKVWHRRSVWLVLARIALKRVRNMTMTSHIFSATMLSVPPSCSFCLNCVAATHTHTQHRPAKRPVAICCFHLEGVAARRCDQEVSCGVAAGRTLPRGRDASSWSQVAAPASCEISAGRGCILVTPRGGISVDRFNADLKREDSSLLKHSTWKHVTASSN